MRNSIAPRPLSPLQPPSPVAATSAREDGGATVSRNYQVGNFQQIEVAGPYDVQVRTGANPSGPRAGPEKLLERTVVEVKGDKLLIRPEEQQRAGSTSAGTTMAMRTSRLPFRS